MVTFSARVVGLSMVTLHLMLPARAHDLAGGHSHPHYDRSVRPPDSVAPGFILAAAPDSEVEKKSPPQALPFEAFAPRVKVRWDEKFLYIENNGIPAHGMMTGITAWQQQVPLPQSYFGDNAWRLPLTPVPAKQVQSIKGRFLRGAIAIAVNGIPIFNPQNNRGEVSQEIGELDQWGGHCGRADDYHYHAAPLHLQTVVGKGLPIAFALDGYPIYGLTEPDGTTPGALDDCSGHTTSPLGYHYHASMKYPYVNGGFHGEVTEREGQVDPQPRAQPVRPDLPPLRGAKITAFKASSDEKSFDLQYAVNGATGSVNYANIGDGSWKFQFVGTDGSKREETYKARGSSPDRNPPPSDRKPQPAAEPSVPASGLTLLSPEVTNGGALPIDYTGDGTSSTLPLQWSGAPPATKSFALIMHHLDPEGKTKTYWTLYNLPADVTSLPKNVKGVGTLGRNSINNQVGYAPPHSKGPGAKTYVLTLYALSAPPKLDLPPAQVTGEILAAAIKNLTLATSDLSVVYTRNGDTGKEEQKPIAQQGDAPDQPPGPPPSQPGQGGPEGTRKPWLQQHGTELDANHDGIITLAEMADDMNRAIALYDASKDGIITGAELTAKGDTRGGAAFAGFIFRHFKELDANNDGTVSREEMISTVKTIFTAGDVDHDGKITTTEWQNAPATPFNAQGPAPAGKPPEAPPAPSSGNKPLIKPGLSDTTKVNVYADNWFVLYLNGKLTAVDSIDFLPHNVVNVDILPEYPMTIAVMAKDNADPKTGLEYGNHIGDAGFILKFADGTVSNASWKAKSYFKGPLNRDVVSPKVEHTPIPEDWFAVNFDDSKWPNATEYTQERIDPKEAFFKSDFAGARFIWTDDLDLDNTVILRARIEKPGWTQRWTTKPDLDASLPAH